MKKQNPILIVSNDDDVIDVFEILANEENINFVFCASIESFISSCLKYKFGMAVLDLSLFSYHKVNLMEIFKDSLFDLKIITISGTFEKTIVEKPIIAADISQKVIYRIVKPISKHESANLIFAINKYLKEVKIFENKT